MGKAFASRALAFAVVLRIVLLVSCFSSALVIVRTRAAIAESGETGRLSEGAASYVCDAVLLYAHAIPVATFLAIGIWVFLAASELSNEGKRAGFSLGPIA